MQIINKNHRLHNERLILVFITVFCMPPPFFSCLKQVKYVFLFSSFKLNMTAFPEFRALYPNEEKYVNTIKWVSHHTLLALFFSFHTFCVRRPLESWCPWSQDPVRIFQDPDPADYLYLDHQCDVWHKNCGVEPYSKCPFSNIF